MSTAPDLFPAPMPDEPRGRRAAMGLPGPVLQSGDMGDPADDAHLASGEPSAAPLSAISVSRAVQVLNGFLGPRDLMTLSELSRHVGMPKSTVFRLVTQLTESGVLERRGRKYGLSMLMFRLGNHHPLCAPGALREIAAPHLGGLFQHTGFTVSLAVREGLRITYLDRVRGPMTGNSAAIVGGQLPVMTTALGKAMMAFEKDEVIRQGLSEGLSRRTPYSIVAPGLMVGQLTRIRQSGLAYDQQETMAGLVCVAAPVLTSSMRPIGALSVSGPVVRFKPESAARLVQRASQLVTADIRRLFPTA